MEKVKFSNDVTYDIKTNGVSSSDSVLSMVLVAPETNLVEVENLVATKDNVTRIELLSETGEVLRIYSDYTILVSIEKIKDVVISTEIVDDEEVSQTSDVIRINLRKESKEEARLTALEETVDLLVLDSLGL